MKTKEILLIIGCLLMTAGLHAQTVFADAEETVITVPVSEDTVTVAQTSNPQIQVLERTWGVNLEEYLRDKIIYLSSHPSDRKVSKQEIQYVYKVYQVPCKSGRRIAYLSMTGNREFFLSLEDPTTIPQDGFYSCYLDYGEATTVSSSRHYTDDEVFGRPASNAQSRWLEAIEF